MALARACVSLTIGMVVLALLAACATPVTLQSKFDPAEAAYAIKPGTGTIEGEAYWRRLSGRIVTVAGLDVRLLPVTPMTQEMMAAAQIGRRVGDIPPELGGYVRVVGADRKGRFKFEKVAAGEYFVFTTLIWTQRIDGKTYAMSKDMFGQIKLAPGERINVVLHGAEEP